MPPSDPLERVLDALRTAVGTLFSAWRRMLGGVFDKTVPSGGWLTATAGRWRSQWGAIRTYVAGPTAAWSGDAAAAEFAAAFGLRAFVFGILAGAAIAIAGGSAPVSAIATLAIESAWAAARLIIVMLLTPAGLLPRRRLIVAYAAGLAPYLFGVLAPLRVVSFLASAFLTYRGLVAAGLGSQDTRLAVGWAFGGQVAVMAFAWIARGALTALVLV
jgi:hypothetical protein